jgi:hypothetical protein
VFGGATLVLAWPATSGRPGVLGTDAVLGPTLRPLFEIDLRFVVNAISRNAHKLVTEPTRLFDIDSCFPMEGALALGEPLVVQGLLGVPFALATDDPLRTFDGVLLSTLFISAMGMYLLVRHLTGSATAGLVAGLGYGFHAYKTHDVAHYFVWDGVWTVLAMLFALRLFQEGRARWGLALAGVAGIQVLGSPYASVAAVLMGLPVFAWLVLRYGVRGRVLLGLVPALLVPICLAWVFFAPYLELRQAGTLFEQGTYYWPYPSMSPGERFFMGWIVPALALAGVFLAGWRAASRVPGDARWAVLAGSVLCLLLATGDVEQSLGIEPPNLPNPWTLLLGVVPALEVVRAQTSRPSSPQDSSHSRGSTPCARPGSESSPAWSMRPSTSVRTARPSRSFQRWTRPETGVPSSNTGRG